VVRTVPHREGTIQSLGSLSVKAIKLCARQSKDAIECESAGLLYCGFRDGYPAALEILAQALVELGETAQLQLGHALLLALAVAAGADLVGCCGHHGGSGRRVRRVVVDGSGVEENGRRVWRVLGARCDDALSARDGATCLGLRRAALPKSGERRVTGSGRRKRSGGVGRGRAWRTGDDCRLRLQGAIHTGAMGAGGRGMGEAALRAAQERLE